MWALEGYRSLKAYLYGKYCGDGWNFFHRTEQAKVEGKAKED